MVDKAFNTDSTKAGCRLDFMILGCNRSLPDTCTRHTHFPTVLMGCNSDFRLEVCLLEPELAE